LWAHDLISVKKDRYKHHKRKKQVVGGAALGSAATEQTQLIAIKVPTCMGKYDV
jgi:hypothetical protein